MSRQGKKGYNSRSLENLRRGNPEHAINVRNASEMARRSAEVRRQNATLREIARGLITEDRAKKMLDALARQAENGNVRAFEVLRDTMDGKPVSVELTEKKIPTVNFSVDGRDLSPEELAQWMR